MTEKTQQSKNPPLRFKQADGTAYPDWRRVRLGDVCNIKYGKDHKKLGNGDIPCMGTGGIMRYVDTPIYEKPSVLIPRKGSLTSLFFADKPFWTVDTLFYTEIDVDKIKPKYLFYHLKTERLERLNTATGVPSLTTEVLNTVKVPLPHKDEQKKIAGFLSTVDNRIALLQAKVDNLQKYKTGILQKIFTQQIRFKQADGSDYTDWESVYLGDIADITTGKLNANAMVENGQYPFFTCARESCKIDTYAFDTEALLISGNGAHVGYIHYYKGKFNAYQRTYVLDNFKTNILYTYYLLENILHKRIASEVKHGNIPYIVKSTLSDLELAMPELAEQQKIADFLSAIDEKITKTQNQLTATKSFKSGLLQQMFI